VNLNLSALIGKAKVTNDAPLAARLAAASAPAVVVTKAPAPGSINEWAPDALANTGPDPMKVSVPMRADGTKYIDCDPQAYADRVRYLEEHDEMSTSDAQGQADAEVWAAQRSIDMRVESEKKIADARAKQEAARAALNPVDITAKPGEATIGDIIGTIPAEESDAEFAAQIMADAIVTPPGENIVEKVADERANNKRKNRKHDREQKAKKIAEEQPVKRKPGRPKKLDALSGKDRQAKSQQKIKAAGGKRTTMNLSPGACEAIAKIVKKQGFKTEREAVEWAVLMGEAQ
jgi:hypothetical protein